MLPTLEDIIRYRYIGKAVFRISGLILITFSIMPLGSWIAEGLRDSDLLWISYYVWRIGSGCGFAFFGLVFLLFAEPIVKLLLPFPKPRCPRCAYSLVRQARPYCPECGLILPPSLIEPTSAGDRPPTAPTPPPPVHGSGPGAS